jgi:hypothetical protein
MSPPLLEVLQALPDPRKPRGVRHPLPAVLALATVAILAGHSSLEAIAQFGRDHGAPLAFALGFRRAKTPTKSALSKLFRRLDVAAFEAALGGWLQGRPGCAEAPAVAIDGKTLRGSKDGEAPGVHLLTAFVPAAAAAIAQLRVDAKTNEHKAALRLLGILPPLAGRVVTGDAMFTHRDFAQEVRDRGGDYLLFAKDNQATLREEVRSALHDDADFSPLRPEGEGGPGADGPDGGQGARPHGGPAADEYDVPERLPGLARRGAGVRGGAGAGLPRGPVGGGGGVRDHEPAAGAGRRGALVGVGPGALGHREPAALREG